MYAVAVLNGACWHQTGKRLRVLGNVSLLRLATYLPELNPQENLWEHQLPNHVFVNYDAIIET